MHFKLFSTDHKKKFAFHLFRDRFSTVFLEVPNGVITIQRRALPALDIPSWAKSIAPLCDLHLTTGDKIEDITNVLQVNTKQYLNVRIFLFVYLG